MAIIYFTERNIHGAWVVYGINGIKQYYGYSKKDAEKLYKTEYKKEVIVNRG